jgi:hypothetical protein
MKNSWTVILALILTAIIIVAALNLQVFPETIFNKKRLDSGNLTYPSNVYHHRRIDNPNQVLQLEMAKVKKKIQYLNDLQIESREFLFHNGDIYWHDKITFPDGANNLNYVLNYKGSHGTLTYYHESTGKWKVEELSNGNLPLSDLFLTIDNKHIILNQPFIYQDLGSGVVKALDHYSGTIKVSKTAQGFKLEFLFMNKPGSWGEIWALESDSPLIDWNYKVNQEIWSGYSYVKENRWLMDGAYYANPETYTPYEKNTYWKHPIGYIVSGFILTGGSRASDDLGYAQLYIQAQNMEKAGYVKSLPESNWLYEEYGMKAGFFDSRFNTDLGLAFIQAYKKFDEVRFMNYALQYGYFFQDFAQKHHYTVNGPWGEEGWLVHDYYHHEENYRPPHCSLNHQLNEIRFLYQLGEITADPSWIALADRLLKGIEITCDSWIKEDKDLHYCYFADGSFGLVDYPYLTYNDLFHLQTWLRKSTGSSNPYLQKLMDAKKIYMDFNGVSGYKK